MRSVKETALAFDRACAKAKVQYALVGGFAVMAWGQPRATMDVDALTRLVATQIEKLHAACADENLSFDLEDAREALHSGRFTIFDKGSVFHVDVKTARTAQERLQVTGAVTVKFETGRIRVAAPEDTIAFKLLFGSPQDLADARSILVRQEGKIDVDALEKRCVSLGVKKKLDALRRRLRAQA